MATGKGKWQLWGVCMVGAVVALSFIVEMCWGSFPVGIFRFPLNILVMALWMMLMAMMYRGRGHRVTRFLLSREATWLSLGMVAVIGITLGLQRKPASTAWPMVVSLLFVQSHLLLVVMRGWRNKGGVRWRFCLTHIGLLLALGAGYWGAADREQWRMPVHNFPSNEAFTMQGEPRRLPYTLELKDFAIEQAENGTPTHYEAQIMVDDERVTLRVNHPYARTLSEKIYLVSFSSSPQGERYAIVEIVSEPWQWLSAAGIILLIAGAMLLFIQGPRKGRIENPI
ncbi:MAG: cytochrome c biogenesis protein ResB [Bacteroidaceae bacterium]|nr:cytochrome c biogenesis protein ResB [Bacteroidaceae bacterium]